MNACNEGGLKCFIDMMTTFKENIFDFFSCMLSFVFIAITTFFFRIFGGA